MKACVLFSGGLDSTVCLSIAVKKYGAGEVLALSVYYGQKHKKEMEFNKSNDILAQSNTNQKFMTKYVLDKYNRQQEQKRRQKLQISRNNKTSQLKHGVLTLGKNWKNKLK